MEFSFIEFVPELFPIDSLYLVAPFWADVDIEGGVGDISYQVYSTGSPLLDTVNAFISDERDFNFNGNWMLLAQWNGVSAYASPIDQASINAKDSIHKFSHDELSKDLTDTIIALPNFVNRIYSHFTLYI